MFRFERTEKGILKFQVTRSKVSWFRDLNLSDEIGKEPTRFAVEGDNIDGLNDLARVCARSHD